MSVSPRLGVPGRGLVGSCAGAGGTRSALPLGRVSWSLGDIQVVGTRRRRERAHGHQPPRAKSEGELADQ